MNIQKLDCFSSACSSEPSPSHRCLAQQFGRPRCLQGYSLRPRTSALVLCASSRSTIDRYIPESASRETLGWRIRDVYDPSGRAGPLVEQSSDNRRAPAGFILLLLSIQLALAPPSPAVLASANPDLDTFENVPSELSSAGETPGLPLSAVVSGPKRREIEGCVRKCVPTCIRGGEGAPGLGPISVRRDPVVFKEGYRSRQYCLSECAQVCALSLDKDKAGQLLQAQQQQQE